MPGPSGVHVRPKSADFERHAQYVSGHGLEVSMSMYITWVCIYIYCPSIDLAADLTIDLPIKKGVGSGSEADGLGALGVLWSFVLCGMKVVRSL